MTAQKLMLTRKRRIITALLLSMILIFSLSITVSATEVPTPDDSLDTMGDKIYEIYYMFRSGVALPCVIISFASAGFRVLGAVFLSKPEMAYDKIKKQVLYTVMAVFVLIFLPVIMGWAKEQLASTAWKPGAVFLPHILPGGDTP